MIPLRFNQFGIGLVMFLNNEWTTNNRIAHWMTMSSIALTIKGREKTCISIVWIVNHRGLNVKQWTVCACSSVATLCVMVGTWHKPSCLLCILSHVNLAMVTHGQSFSSKYRGDSSTTLIPTYRVRSDWESFFEWQQLHDINNPFSICTA